MTHDTKCPFRPYRPGSGGTGDVALIPEQPAAPCQCVLIASVREEERKFHQCCGGGNGQAHLTEILQRIYATFTTEQAAIWLDSPNSFLGGVTPRNALDAGRLNEVDSALRGFSSGVYA